MLRNLLSALLLCCCHGKVDASIGKHNMSEIILGIFLIFTIGMIAFHCFLKSRLREKSEMKMKNSYEFDEEEHKYIKESA